jgi:hypothetical protein
MNEELSNGWLYQQIVRQRRDWEPEFALRSAVNWVKSLSFEIAQEHGTSHADELNSCRTVFEQNCGPRHAASQLLLAPIFGPLFHSLTFVVSLASMSQRNAAGEWAYPGVVVWWYYAIYHAFRSMLAAFDDREPNTHREVIASANELTDRLPHPFNMVAVRVRGEEHMPTLPSYRNANEHDLVTHFDATRPTSQGMLLTYLKGTAGWVVGNIKERLKHRYNLRDFRTAEARRLRDRNLPVRINVLNCAFRYRGKANYRDGLFLTYGEPHSWLTQDFVSDLFTVASFAFVCGLAYAERRVGRNQVHDFLNDSRVHFRGLNSTTDLESFWIGF